MTLPSTKSVVYSLSFAAVVLVNANTIAAETSEEGGNDATTVSAHARLPIDAALASMISEFNQDMKDQFGYQLSAMTLAPASAGAAGLRARSLRPDEIAFRQCGLVELPGPVKAASSEDDAGDEPDTIWTCIVIGIGW